MSRYATYYRAKAAAYKAEAEVFKIDPTYDGNEERRADLIEFYEGLAKDYEDMAITSES